ncbi:hypothetical protein ACET3Z_016576 [Daucus carota]
MDKHTMYYITLFGVLTWNDKTKGGSRTAELISPKHMDIEGYKVQSEMVIEGFDRLIMGREERKESRGCSPEPAFCDGTCEDVIVTALKGWRAEDFDVERSLHDRSQGLCFKFLRWHPRGHLIMAGSEDSTVWLWNADKDGWLNMFSGHTSSVTCGEFKPDGNSYILKNLVLSFNNYKKKRRSESPSKPYDTSGVQSKSISNDTLSRLDTSVLALREDKYKGCIR